jgi:hypothetical protein
MSKNIVFLCDGTGNNKDFGTPTNVARLFGRCLNQLDEIEAGRPALQVVAYDRGIGSFPTDLIAQATGIGISDNIKDGYRFLARHYEPGDRIFLFGFSRGAYTARSIGGMLGIVGLPRHMQANGSNLKRNDRALDDLVSWAYKIYKMPPTPVTGGSPPLPGSREHGAAEFIGLHGWPEHNAPQARAPYLIGVWDTVRALGIPLGFTDVEVPGFSHRFHNHDLNRHVAHAYHALAIDEERLQFLPTIWNEPTAAQKHADASGEPNRQRFEQVWFPGNHSDVGGGYAPHPHEVASGQLSEITLGWMITRAVAAGLKMNASYAANPLEGLRVNPGAVVNDSRPTFWTRLLYRRVDRQVLRGAQAPGETAITEALGPGLLRDVWLQRIAALFGSDAAYQPGSLQPHDDYMTAERQLNSGKNPPPGPFRYTV